MKASAVSDNISIPTPKKQAVLWIWLVLIIAASIIPYISSLKGDFVVDDEYVIIKNNTSHSIRNAAAAFTERFLTNKYSKDMPYYRPLTIISFQADYSLFGQNPFAFRLTNLILFLITALLVFAIALKLTKNVTIAGLAGVFFAVFPSHSESVAWISGRTDILCCLFTEAAFLVFITTLEGKQKFRWKSGILCSLLFMCALFSKEASLVMPVLMIAYPIVFSQKLKKSEIIKWVVFLLIPSLVYIALRSYATSTILGSQNGGTLFLRLLRAGLAYACYLKILFIPTPLKIIYNIFAGKGYLILAIAWLLPAGIAVFAIAKRKVSPVVSYCLLWIIISLLPVVGIIPFKGSIPSHRFTYMASIGSSIILGWLVWKGLQIKIPSFQSIPALVMIVTAGYLLYSTATAIIGSRVYKTNLNWAYAISNTDTNLFHGVSGSYFFEAGLYNEAEIECEKDVMCRQNEPDAYIRLAVIKKYLNKQAEAKILLDRARSLHISDIDTQYNLGIAYIGINDWSDAEKAFIKCVRMDPKEIEYQQQLANIYFTRGKYLEAVKVCEYILTLPSSAAKDHYNLGLAYKAAKRPQKAAKEFRYVIETQTNGKLRALSEKQLAEVSL